ncbi:MAG: hypothetical protein M3R51_05490 [Candidatus Eremiobacteraeota bacterium]|nr:hypothetical protein [Candidatus Eremiobacteraeota bacterium]
MSRRAIAIALKIPDNTARTAQTALRRLGVDAAYLERSEIWRFDDSGDSATIVARVGRNESIFNANKHRLIVLDDIEPRAGEIWVERLGNGDATRRNAGGRPIEGATDLRRCVGWRFLRQNGDPENIDLLRRAASSLLCNPAIERALLREVL